MQFFGLQHFDHLGGALLVLAQYTVPDGAYDPLHLALETEPGARGLTWLLFLSVTCVCTFVVLGLALAVVNENFQSARDSGGGPQQGSLGKAAADPRAQEPAAAVAAAEPRGRRSLRASNGRKWATSAVDRLGGAVTAMILAHSAVILAYVQEPGTFWLEYFLAQAIASVFFSFELVLRLASAGFSLRAFLGNPFNMFETAMVLCGVTGLALGSTALGLVPILRMYRLMRYSPAMNGLLVSLTTTRHTFLQLLLFAALCVLAFAVLARHLFRGRVGMYSPSDFGDLGQGVLTAFQLFTGDQWSLVMYAAVASMEGPFSQFAAASFIIAWLFLSKIILFDLFIVMVMQHFAVTDTIDAIKMPGRIESSRVWLRSVYTKFFSELSRRGRNRIFSASILATPERRTCADTDHRVAGNFAHGITITDSGSLPWSATRELAGASVLAAPNAERARFLHDLVLKVLPSEFKLEYPIEDNVVHDQLESAGVQLTPDAVEADLDNGQNEPVSNIKTLEAKQGAKRICERAVRGHKCKNHFRLAFMRLRHHICFVGFIYICILCSCLLLMSAPPAPDVPNQHSLLSPALVQKGDFVFTIIFTIEMLVSIAAQGLILDSDSYLRSAWNAIDAIIVLCSWLDQAQIFSGSIAKIFRLARILRPLRLIKWNKSLRSLVEALLCTLAPVSYLACFSFVTFTAFTILGKGLFAGKLFRCSYGAEYPEGRTECSGLFFHESLQVLYPRAWDNPKHHFDTFFQASLTVFRIQTLKYVDIVRGCMDITEVSRSPLTKNSPWNSLFFVACILIGPFIIMNVFIAFICDGFNVFRLSVEAERKLLRFMHDVQRAAPSRNRASLPRNKFRVAVRHMQNSKRFIFISMTCVCINICFLLSDHAEKSESFLRMYDTQNHVFFGELLFEVMLGVIGFGVKGYLTDHWRAMDFLIAVGTTVGYLSTSKTIETFSKAFRVFRILRLVRMFKAVKIVLSTILSALPEVANVLLLLILIYSMFAALFVQVFGVTKFGARIGPTANFESFSAALSTIYQMVIGDEWMAIMDDAEIDWPECTPVFNSVYIYDYTGTQYSFGDCGSPYSRYIFVVFKLFCECILLNLFIGVVLENFSSVTDELLGRDKLNMSHGISRNQIQSIAAAFKKHSRCREFLSVNTVVNSLLSSIEAPFSNFWPIKDQSLISPRQCNWHLPASRLVRAELNLILKERRHAAEEARGLTHGSTFIAWCKTAIIRLTTGIFSDFGHPGYSCTLINGVSFQEVVMTLAFWKCPEIIPESLRHERRQRVQYIVLMACGLVVTDFLRKNAKDKRWRQIRQEYLGKVPEKHPKTVVCTEFDPTESTMKSVQSASPGFIVLETVHREFGCHCNSPDRPSSKRVPIEHWHGAQEDGCSETCGKGHPIPFDHIQYAADCSKDLVAAKPNGPFLLRYNPDPYASRSNAAASVLSPPSSMRTDGRRLANLVPLIRTKAQAFGQDECPTFTGASRVLSTPLSGAKPSTSPIGRRRLQALPAIVLHWRGLDSPNSPDCSQQSESACGPILYRRILRPLPLSSGLSGQLCP